MGIVISCMSNIMYLSEKIILYSTCVALVSTVVLMFVVTLGMGIGLGYNYCFVDMKTKYKYVPGHYVYPQNLRYPYYRKSGDQGRDVDFRAAEQERETDELRYSPTLTPEQPATLPSFSPYRRNKFGILERISNVLANSTTEAYDFENEDYFANSTVADVYVDGTQFENTTAATEGTETTETITTTETIETEATTDTVDTTDTTEIAESKTDDMYSIDDPTPEPVFPDEKRRVKKLVIPISGLDLVSLLSKLSAEKNNHSLQIVTT